MLSSVIAGGGGSIIILLPFAKLAKVIATAIHYVNPYGHYSAPRAWLTEFSGVNSRTVVRVTDVRSELTYRT